MISHVEMITRIAVAALLGGAIGFERDIHGRQAGLRTHLLVSMASATFMVVSNHFYFFQNYSIGSHPIEADVSRIAASVVTGIGFLAGGAILKTGATVHGLTTAAGLWLVAAIGLCSGGGMYVEGVAVTLMGLIALTFMRLFEDKNDKVIRRRVSLEIEDAPERISNLMGELTGLGIVVPDFDYERKVETKRLSLAFEAGIPVQLGVNGLIAFLEKQSGVQHVHIKVKS